MRLFCIPCNKHWDYDPTKIQHKIDSHPFTYRPEYTERYRASCPTCAFYKQNPGKKPADAAELKDPKEPKMASLPDKFEAVKGELFQVYPEMLTLVTDKEHYLYSPDVNEPFEESWVKAAMSGGMPDPIEVQRVGDDLIVVDGRKRTKSCVEANKRLRASGREPIRVRILRERGDEAEMMGLMISSNELRREDSLPIKAMKLSRYLATGKTKKEAAITFGITLQSVENWIAYHSLPAVLKKTVEEGLMKASAAMALSGLTVEEQKAKLEELRASGAKITTATARNVKAGKAATASRPSRKVVESLLRLDEIPGEFIAFIKWILGEKKVEDVAEVNSWFRLPERPVKVPKSAKSQPTTGKVKIVKKKRKAA